MRAECLRHGILLALPIVLGLTTWTSPQNATRPPVQAAADLPAAVREGAVLFRQQCVSCHGVSARGGLRGPDLTTGNWSHGGSDEDLARTLRDGVTGTAMSPSYLTDGEIGQVIAFLRTLQQPSQPAAGDVRRGEELFFGELRCSSCHIVNGKGGLLGPELSTVGSSRSRSYLVDSIREPGRQLSENLSFGGYAVLKYDTVSLVTAEGTTIVGVPLNEDTFTVQVMDMGERVHMLEKSKLQSFRHEKRSLMPAYDAKRLSDSELDDLVAYLQTLRVKSPSREGESREDR